MNKEKLVAHLVTLPRPFAIPFFGCAMLAGVNLAGGSIRSLSTLLAFICCALLMASGHAANSFWDWQVGLDKGEERSVEKGYTGGCGVIARGIVSVRGVILNSIACFVLALIPAIILSLKVNPYIFILTIAGIAIPYLYTKGKFNYYHELMLASGVVVAVLMGAMSTGTGNYLEPLLVAIPISMIFSFAGLALDEWPDAEANLKKGVKSLAYKVYEYKIDLGAYLMLWFISAYVFQTFLIAINILKPLSMISFLTLPGFIVGYVFLKSSIEFEKVAKVIVLIAALYPVLLFMGQILG